MTEWALEYASGKGFPSFAPVFNPAKGAIKVVHSCIKTSPDLTREVVALFSDRNWRPQLVGCVAMLLGASNDEIIAALWEAFDNGSWVSPQLAVTALRCDPYFESEAVEYIEHIKTAWRRPEDDGILPIRSNPALAMDSKSISALLGLCETIPALAGWAEGARKHPSVAAVLATPYEDGGRIALYWHKQIDKVMGGGI